MVDCRLGCPTLHDMHQITPFKKYVIPIYKKLGFKKFQSLPLFLLLTNKFGYNINPLEALSPETGDTIKAWQLRLMAGIIPSSLQANLGNI